MITKEILAQLSENLKEYQTTLSELVEQRAINLNKWLALNAEEGDAASAGLSREMILLQSTIGEIDEKISDCMMKCKATKVLVRAAYSGINDEVLGDSPLKPQIPQVVEALMKKHPQSSYADCLLIAAWAQMFDVGMMSSLDI